MDFDAFAMVMGAVLLANLLTVSFVYGVTLLTKAEQNHTASLAGLSATLVPIGAFLLVMLGIVPKPF